MKKSLLYLSAIIMFASCQKSDRYFDRGCIPHDPPDQQENTDAPNLNARGTWGKNWNYVSPTNVTQRTPYNCYDNVQTDPITAKQIATADGPRYAATVASYFNGSDWDDVFPGLADIAYATDLAKLRSGEYYFEVRTNGNTTYLVVRQVSDPEDIHFVLGVEETE